MSGSLARLSPSGPFTVLSVSLISELSGRSGVQDGVVAFETATLSWWVFRRGSSLTLQADTIVAGVGGQWLRLFIGHPVWLNQFAWFVSSSGSNKARGDSPSAAVKDISEIVRRLGPGAKMGGSDVTVTVSTSLTDPTPMTLDIEFTTDHGLRMLAVPVSSLYVGSLTAAYVAPNKATQQRSQITDAAMPNFTTFGYQMVRMTSGAQAQATAPIIKRTANTIALTGSFLNLSTAAVTANPSISPAIVSPANGDTYVMDQMPILAAFSVRVKKPGFSRAALVVDGFEFSNTSAPSFEVLGPGGTGQRGFVLRCIFRGSAFTSNNITFQGCEWAALCFMKPQGEFVFWANSCIGFTELTVAKSGTWAIDGLTVIQGGNNNVGGIAVPGSDTPGLFTVRGNCGIITGVVGGTSGGFGVFDSRSQGGVRISTGASAAANTADGVVYGNGNAQFGFDVQAGGVFSYFGAAGKPTCTGATPDVSIAGLGTLAYAAIPAFEGTTTAAGIVSA